MIKIINGEKIEDTIMEKFERKFNIKLPNDYKSFLVNNNGGEIEGDWIFDFYDNVIDKYNSSIVRNFFRIYKSKDDKDKYDNLEKICKVMWKEKTLSKSILPFADDPGGNIICISLDSRDYGTIYFVNHEYEDSETGYLCMSKITSSFTEFLNCMYLDEE